MKSPFLQEMTASEPLTLEEEYEMQTSWHEDEESTSMILVYHFLTAHFFFFFFFVELTFIITSLPNGSDKSLQNMSNAEIKENTSKCLLFNSTMYTLIDVLY
jgi:hypothetical protein